MMMNFKQNKLFVRKINMILPYSNIVLHAMNLFVKNVYNMDLMNRKIYIKFMILKMFFNKSYKYLEIKI